MNIYILAIIILIILFLPFFLFLVLIPFNQSKNPSIALVLGAGVLPNKYPTTVLSYRLDKVKELYMNGNIQKIIVSGDNRVENYNEPEAMENYLEKQGVPSTDIIKDLAGRRTIDSCWRAKNVFKAKEVYIVTQAFHMGRAMFLCKSVGLKVKSAYAKSEPTELIRSYLREIPASLIALLESFYYEPPIKSDGTEQDLSNY